MELTEFFRQHPRCALAFSGGVDSAYLLYAGLQAGAHIRAYYVKSAFQPQFELEDARRLARELGAELRLLELDVLSDDKIRNNPENRCYYCKKRIFSAIRRAAEAEGFPIVIDGTNASDKTEDRPGMLALEQLQVCSPLRLCGLTKSQIRQRSKEAGLFTHNKPAYACLATRIPTGRVITAELLQATEQAEGYLAGLGFTDFRIRLLDTCARVQLPPEQLGPFLSRRQEILEQLKNWYSGVVLDLEVRSE